MNITSVNSQIATARPARSAAAPQPEAPAGDSFTPADHAAAQLRCQKAIGKLSAGVGGVAFAALGAAVGSAAGAAGLGAVIGGALGATASYFVGFHQAAKLHKPENAEPLTTWQDPPRTSAEGAETMRNQVSDLQHRLLDAGKVPHLDRGFHEKQNWAGKAHVEFSKDMPEELQKGVLEHVAGHSYTAAVRFSNGQGCPFADAKPDARGLAVKMDIDGQQADLLSTNHITFARTPEQFMRFAHVAGTKQTKGPLAALGEVAKNVWKGEFNGKEALRILKSLAHDTSKRMPHVAGETYWTQAEHVGNLTGRFVFTPESGADSRPPRFGADANYLRKEMETDLEKGPIKMKIGFEAFTDDAVASDASIHGEHVTYNVGELVFDQREADTDERKSEEATISKMAFNPGNGFELAGTINESNRGEIYKQSAKNRGAYEWSAPEVQGFFGH